MNIPTNPSDSFKALNPHLYGSVTPVKTNRSTSTAIKPVLNKTEARYRDVLKGGCKMTIWEQAITLRLDPPFKSYRPDLAYMNHRDKLTFVEVKGPHRFREKGIAKVALAAKTYPQFDFVLAEWKDGTWKVTNL